MNITGYQKLILSLDTNLTVAEARRIEGAMRLTYGALDSLSRADFRHWIGTLRNEVRSNPDEWDANAGSFGLTPDPCIVPAATSRGSWRCHMKKTTPWGIAQSETAIAPGITFYSTAGHGGYHVAPKLRPAMGALAQNPFAGPGWFEEDCDWARVALAFPDEFCVGHDRENVLRAARHTLKMSHPEILAAWDAEKGGDPMK